jgi:hypothetical protein
MSIALSVCIVFGLNTTALASNVEKNITDNTTINILNTTDSTIEYTEKRSDGDYYISEKFDGNKIYSQIYKISNENKELISTLTTTIEEGIILCNEIDSNGNNSSFSIRAEKINSNEENNPTLNSRSDNKRYIRTDKYGISLVGKRTTIMIAAGAILAVTPLVTMPTAVQIITAAISGGGLAGVSSLPDYLYVTSDVYRTRGCGKIYTRYENKYYLDSDRTEYVGKWTFRKRGFEW